MKCYLEVADIVLKVQKIEQIKELLQKVLEDIDSTKNKCTLWIEEKENLSYTEIKEYIRDKFSEILRNYFTTAGITIGQLADSSQSSEPSAEENRTIPFNTSSSSCFDYQSLQDKYDTLSLNVSSQSKQFKKLKRKLKDQETNNEFLEEKLLKVTHDLEGKFVDFSKNCTQELHLASSFMSQLQTQCQTLTTEFKENEEKQDTKINALSKRTEEVEQTYQENNKTTEIFLQKQECLAKALEHINILEKEVVEVKENQYKQFKSVQTIEKEMKVKRFKKISEFICKETGIFDVPCVAACHHIIGHHEQQISEGGEADLYNQLVDCYKNPNHSNFIPVNEFRLEHLPPGHQNKDLYEFIKVAADMTVRISVSLTSLGRPEFWPNTNIPYFLYNVRRSQHFRTGSGMVIKVRKEVKDTCPCRKCKLSGNPNKVWWAITVRTAASVVFNTQEASHSTCSLFYDTEDNPGVVLKDTDRVIKNTVKDWCLLDYVTCNYKLVDKLENMVKQYYVLYRKINDRYKPKRDIDKLMFLVSHPHGCSKQVSLGQWKNKVKLNGDSNMMAYFTPTCPGSSGACVHCLGYGVYVHCGSLTSGLNYSNETISLP
ncbi:uncharacterized protein LOC129928240 isoform X2 [Biomphalaria glabrata]|nr:uncharacterized protein LOC129928240 isoform X2 [Biomphalaria glabrata]XP_055897629.1 uncharacterized protein LOC129928240 isoform X2 [Biomphalaria glabrata]